MCVDRLQQVRLHFDSITLNTSYGCDHVYLNIYEGHDTTPSMVVPFCNTFPSDFISSGNTVFVSVVAASSTMQSFFIIHYSATDEVGGMCVNVCV